MLNRSPTKQWLYAVYFGAAAILVTAVLELLMQRSFFGPDDSFGFWEGNIWSSACSQRVADAYSFSHIIHGFLFYGFFWMVARRFPVPARFAFSTLLELGWELLENSPIIINRYRDSTMALGYEGDSILNSTSDIVMMMFGFLLAWKIPVWASIVLVLAMEIGCALWIRDNLTLNVLMLFYPIESIKQWQLGSQPG